MSLILAWVLFPLVLGAVGLGWGALVERASGARARRRAADPAGAGRGARRRGHDHGLQRDRPGCRHGRRRGRRRGAGARLARRGAGPEAGRCWPRSGVLLVYGAPVLVSGQATFTGYIKLDDTATWFNVIDNVMTHGRSVAGLPPSTYRLQLRPGQPRLPAGRLHAPGRRPGAHRRSTSRGCSSPTWRAARPPWRCRLHALMGPLDRLAAAAGAAGVPRRPGVAALRLQPVGRDQGADRRVPAGAGRRARRRRCCASARRAGAR